MSNKVISAELIEGFIKYLIEDEKSSATIEKYVRDVKQFQSFSGQSPVDKMMVLKYKDLLSEEYAVSSANSMIAALNVFFSYTGWRECHLKRFKVQKQVYCPENKELSREEYFRLLDAAVRRGDRRLFMIMQTICATGIRVSELEYITTEAVKKGEAEVNCKGKLRKVFIVTKLQDRLQEYIDEENIKTGPVFITRNGTSVSRNYIWRQMKGLCEDADISPTKIFPHNLRHLFARSFYDIERDIVKLADVLGHASINTTRIYTITPGLEHRDKMESMRLIV